MCAVGCIGWASAVYIGWTSAVGCIGSASAVYIGWVSAVSSPAAVEGVTM